jgi:hypothetical protein
MAAPDQETLLLRKVQLAREPITLLCKGYE